MKPAQVNKLYAKLTPQEQAALAFEAATRQDEAEINAILDNVPQLTYTSVHTDYRRRVNGLYTLAGQFGIEYWRNLSYLMSALALYALDARENHLTACKSLDAKLVAMHIALADVCAVFKVSMEAIKAVAGCRAESQYDSMFDMPADAKLVARYTEQYIKLGRQD